MYRLILAFCFKKSVFKKTLANLQILKLLHIKLLTLIESADYSFEILFDALQKAIKYIKAS